MQASDLVLVRGLADTRATLAVWNERPWPVIGRWVAGSLAVTTLLLAAVWVIAMLSVPDAAPPAPTFLARSGDPDAVLVLHVLWRNGLVLALHALACVAGFIAGSSLPEEARRHTGAWRWIHEKAGPLAIGFVLAATTFSLVTQAFVLGRGAADLGAQLGVSPALLLAGLLPHALPELVALFLPLAAWVIASRRRDWHELLAATAVTVMLAVPMLLAAAVVEVYASPGILRSLAG
jgi:hypothetical protein